MHRDSGRKETTPYHARAANRGEVESRAKSPKKIIRTLSKQPDDLEKRGGEKGRKKKKKT